MGALSGCQGTAERGRAVHAASKPATATGTTSDGSLEGLTAPEISRRMWATMNAARSMTLDFSGVLRAKPAQMRIAMSMDGKCAAAVRQSGWTMQIIRTDDGTSYIKGDAGYWTALGPKGKSIGQLAGGRWIKFPAVSVPGRRLAASCDLDGFLGRMKLDHSSSTKSGTGTIGRQPVVTIRQKDPEGTNTLSVAAKGKPYLLKIASDKGELTMAFGAFDQPVNVTAPPANQTVDLSLFGGDKGLDV